MTSLLRAKVWDGLGRGGEVGNRDLLPHKSQLIPVPSLQNRNGNVGSYVRYCNSYHWEVLSASGGQTEIRLP